MSELANNSGQQLAPRPASPQISDIDRVHLHFAFVPLPRPEQAQQTKQALLDHLVGALLQNPRHVEAKHLGGDEDLCGLRQNASAYVGLGSMLLKKVLMRRVKLLIGGF
jgi:hypothetical protein